MTDQDNGARVDEAIDEALEELARHPAPARLRARVASQLGRGSSWSPWRPGLLPAGVVASALIALAVSILLFTAPWRWSSARPGETSETAGRLQRGAPASADSNPPEREHTPRGGHSRPPEGQMAGDLRRPTTASTRPHARATGAHARPSIRGDQATRSGEANTAVRAVIVSGTDRPAWAIDPVAPSQIAATTPLPSPNPVVPAPVVVSPIGIAAVEVDAVTVRPIEIAPFDQSQPPSPLPESEAGRHEDQNPGRR